MAESIVSLAIERITDLLIYEASFLNDVKEEVESLKAELERMKSFLKDVDRKQEHDERLRTRVREIRDLAYDAEDVIDSYILQVAHRGGFHRIVKRFTTIFSKASHLHEIGKQVKAIQTKLGDISRSLPAYGISGEGSEGSSSAAEMQRRLRRSYPHVEEDDVVSLEVSTRDVLHQLMKEDQDNKFHIVSIVGMGGIGKTTLAKKVYNHNGVKRHFDCCAWIFISQQCMPREVFHGVLIKVLSPSRKERELIDKLKEDELVEMLYNVLKQKRYLVVLDDIWRCEDWDSLKPAFPRGNKGSKLLLTTRNKEVALFADPFSSPIEIPFLTDDESWKLFRRKAFAEHEMEPQACSNEFEMLGKEMLKKCGGLPLAIVVLGGLLATKKSRNEWEMVHRNIKAQLNKFQQRDYHYGGVNWILALSYNELPFYLKPCFLYLGHYPEDWEISKKELIRLWIAEGFISASYEGSGEMLMEDVAEQYLEELINRCLVQVGKRDHTGTGVKTCRIHDLLRDLCLIKGRDENFLGIIQPPLIENHGHQSLDVTLTPSMARRIAVHPTKRYVCLNGKHLNLRSLLLFQNEELIKLQISNCNHFKFLRVLNLVRNNVSKWHVSKEIGNLLHLRYLSLKSSLKVILPPSICKIKSLHTLKIQSYSVRLPNVLFMLERLRHILLLSSEGGWQGVKMCFPPAPPRDTPKTIETLKYVQFDENLLKNNAAVSLSNVQNLGISFKRSKDVEAFLKSLIQLHRLRSMRMVFDDSISISYTDLEPLSQSQSLSKLFLKGKLEENPDLSHVHVLKFVPANIAKLTLWVSQMKQDPMPVLEKLPHLRVLNLLSRSYMGTRLVCSANGFLQLDYLYIVGLSKLEEWEIEEGAMPSLRTLLLSSLSNLRMFPEGLRYVTSLQEMELYGMKRSLLERIQVIDGREGDDFSKVKHIPYIRIIS
ncbi:hypothetical protein REPUB_Repub13aG0086000 [Reevesia pubescens]